MIQVTNGKVTTTVTKGAFDSIFSKLGYKRVNENEPAATHVAGSSVVEQVDEAPEADAFADLVTKPVSQWSKHELQEFVNAKGIDTSNAKTVAEVKAIVKEYIEAAN